MKTTSKTLGMAMLLLLLPSALVAQMPREEHPWLVTSWHLDVGFAGAGQDTRITVDAGKGLDNPPIDLERDLRLGGNEGSPAFNGRWRFGDKWSVFAQRFGVSRSDETTLERDIQWNEETFRVGATVGAGFEYDITRLFFGRTFHAGSRHEFGGGLGLHWMEFRGYIRGEAFVDDESQGVVKRSANASAPLPNLGLWYIYALSPQWAIRARLDGLSASVGDYSGILLNTAFELGYQPWEHVGFSLQYNFFRLNVDVDDKDWRGDVDARWAGPYLGLSFTW